MHKLEEFEQHQTVAVDERGLALIDGRLTDPETGEVIALDEQLYAGDLLKAAAIRASDDYLHVDAQIAHAKERKEYWELREKVLKNRREWFDKTIGRNITQFAESIRADKAKLVEVGQVVVKFTQSLKGKIEVINRKEEKQKAIDWLRVKCSVAVVPTTGEAVSVSAITEDVRKELFKDVEAARQNGFEVEPPGDRQAIISGGAK